MKTCIALIAGILFLLPWSQAQGQAFAPLTSQKNQRQMLAWLGWGESARKETPYTLRSNWPPTKNHDPRQPVAENLLARNYVLIFDGSGSMMERKCSGNRRKIEVAKDAVSAWARSIPEDANVGLVAFYENTFSRLPLAAKNRGQFLKVVNDITAGGGTPLGQAVNFAHQMLTGQAQSQLGYGEYHIVVVTDGEANNPSALTDAVKAVLDRSPIIIHTIGFCIDEKHSLNQPGRTVYKTADNPESLRKGLQDVLAEAESFDLKTFDK
jgi:Ca-activated chloride channel homolog